METMCGAEAPPHPRSLFDERKCANAASLDSGELHGEDWLAEKDELVPAAAPAGGGDADPPPAAPWAFWLACAPVRGRPKRRTPRFLSSEESPMNCSFVILGHWIVGLQLPLSRSSFLRAQLKA